MIEYDFMIRDLLNLVWPLSCPICRTGLREKGLCRNCLNNIKRINPRVNEIRYQKKGVYYQRVYSAGLYDGVLKDAVLLFKYRQRFVLAGILSKMLVEFAQAHLNISQFDIVAPVPLHRAKLRERGFNQAGLLARHLASRFGIPFSERRLVRVKVTPAQSYLNKLQRLRNLKGAFRVRRPEGFNKKRVLLVDDVFTTGATANECAKVLLSSGARSVSVLTLARGE